LKLFAVGDIMLDRKVGERIKADGSRGLLAAVAPDLARADLVFANLESPLSTEGPHDPANCCFRADPATVKVLALGHIGIVSLANNHTLNPGRVGIVQTMDTLDKAGIRYCGAAREQAQASWPRVMNVKGFRVGFQAFTDLDFAHGSYSKVPRDLEWHKQQITQAKNKCDLLVVSYHWGVEENEAPTARQKQIAHLAIAAGADVVLGHHPHVLEGVEFYQGHPILYSLGNFVFDQRPGLKTQSGVFHLLYTEGQGWTVKMLPVTLPRPRLGPEFPAAGTRDAILKRFAGYCQQLGTPHQVEQGMLVMTPSLAASTPSAAAATAPPASPGSAGLPKSRR
jgi:poly-gamma-glutamate synthesis protein (capsule biosynthesis protein)